MKAEIYSKSNCPHCVTAIKLLEQAGAEITIFKIDADEKECIGNIKLSSREELFKRIPNVRSVPQIFIDTQYIGGLSELKEKLSNV